MSKFSSYVRSTMAMFKGDTDKMLAEKNFRTVLNGIDIQVSLLKGEKFKKEELVSQAEEDLKTAKFPTTKVTDTDDYFEAVNYAKNKVVKAKEELKAIEESILEYEALKQEFSVEVEGKEEESK